MAAPPQAQYEKSPDQESDERNKMDPLVAKVSRDDGSVINLEHNYDDNTNIVVVEQIIEAIGMGVFQWKLALTCAFGFVVDQESIF